MVKAVLRLQLFLAALAMPALLGGCVAMRSDLDPIRSDVAVLERQVADMQGEVSQVKRRVMEGQEAPGGQTTGTLAGERTRLGAIEHRLDGIEARLKGLEQAQSAAVVPQPVGPEPVIIEPMEGAPKAPAPAPAAPGGKPGGQQ